ncbi:MAG: hypothetical protein CVU02_01625 [Bacteroidetes bacterium HGW-Bacteroidetes-19]|nr:MAG: hypothetical protein CVU04_04810 [Bacteroidetes bacterium HGW-Bacteroidetes-20]PKP28216.1 MAG: hypothetical protein CVU02_01625 [Bacteroidetes bacterium HGW-Bacteroidetes-19]
MKKFNFLFLLFAIQTLLFSQNNRNTHNRDWDQTTFVNNQEINLYPFIYTDILQATVSGEDLGISEITTNYSSTFSYLGVPINCFIKVNNYGSTPASNFSITLSDVNGFSHTDTISTTLNSGQYTYYPIAWTPSATGNKTITAIVNNSGDLVSTNNTKTATLSVYQYQVTAAPTPSVRSIAEFEPQRGAFVRATVSGSSVTFGVPLQLLTEIAENDTLYVVCSNQTAANTIQTYLTNNSIDGSRIKYVLAPTNSHWTRDFGPWFIENNERNLEIIDFPYNRPRANDSQVPRAFGTTTGTTVYGMPLLHTGGNFMADGFGVAASCDLVQYENNCYSNTELDEIYLNYLGVSTYHQIPDPLNSYIQHIDCWGKFLAPDKIMILQVPSSNANYTDLENAAQYFANQTSSFGNKYKVYRVYTPNNQPYTNSLILNNKVLVPMNPTYGSSCYQNALAAYQQAMPGYEIIGVPYNDWYDTDALHCRAIQIPQADMLRLVHYPLLDSVAYQNTISITANAYTLGNNSSVSENLTLHYKINGANFQPIAMQALANDQFSANITGLNPNDTVRYYIEATNTHNKTAFQPFIGSADPYMFYLKSGVAVNEFSLPLAFQIYPNPASQFFNIAVDADQFSVEIYNTLGQKVAVEKNNLQINIQHLSSGTYIVKVTAENRIGYQKTVIN